MAIVADELLLMVRANVGQAMAGLSAVETKASGMGGKIAGFAGAAGKAILGIGVAAGAIGIASGKMANDFEESMAQIEALVGVPKDEMAELEAAALRMGREFGVSAKDAAGGLFFLKSAGLETGDAIKALEQSAAASAIGLGSMESLANTATTAMSNFGLESQDAFDMITTAARLAKADPSELGDIMNKNSASAALLGVEYAELGGLSALLTRKFGDAAASGTGLSNIMNKIIKPSEMAKDALEGIGWTADDLKQKVSSQGLQATLFELNDAFAESGIATDQWIGKVMEDSRGIRAAAAIIQTSGEEIDEIFTGMAESGGALEKGWNTMAVTGNVRLRKAMEGLKSALIPIGAAVMDLVVPAIQFLANGLTSLVNLFQGDATGALGTFGDKFQDVFWGIVQVAQQVFGLITENWDDIKAIFEAIATTFMGLWEEVSAVVGPLVKDIFGFISEQVGAFVDWFQEIWPMLRDVIMGFLGFIQRAWTRTWDAVKDHILPLWEAIKKIIGGAMNVIKGIIQTVLAILTGDWSKAWDGIKMIFSGIWEAIVGILEGAWTLLKAAFDLGIATIVNIWDAGWTLIGGGIESIWNGIVAFVKGGVNGVIGWINSLINAAISAINQVIALANKIPGVNMGEIGAVTLPALANGGTVLKGGAALVGERGPEIVSLPRGAMVEPLSANRNQAQTIILQVGNEEFAKFVLDQTGLSSMRQARRTA